MLIGAGLEASSAARLCRSSRAALTAASRCRPARTAALSTSRMSTVGSFSSRIFVDADDHILAAIDPRLPGRGGFLDHRLGPARCDRLRHAALGLDALDQRLRGLGQFRGQRLDIIAAAERIDDVA